MGPLSGGIGGNNKMIFVLEVDKYGPVMFPDGM